MKKKNFYVIGGEFEDFCYGGAPTLLGAKRLAGKHLERREDPVRFVRPYIYRAEDTELVEAISFYANGRLVKKRVPKEYAMPIC